MSSQPKLPRKIMVPVARRALAALTPHFDNSKVCGSLRRGDPQIGDVDIVVSGPKGSPNVDQIIKEAFPGAERLIEGKEGPRKCWVVPLDEKRTVHVDVWMVDPDKLGAALLYATGNGIFNVIMHRWARFKGMDLQLQGVMKDGKIIASQTEQECFEALGWQYVSPPMRSVYWISCKRYLDEMNSNQMSLPGV